MKLLQDDFASGVNNQLLKGWFHYVVMENGRVNLRTFSRRKAQARIDLLLNNFLNRQREARLEARSFINRIPRKPVHVPEQLIEVTTFHDERRQFMNTRTGERFEEHPQSSGKLRTLTPKSTERVDHDSDPLAGFAAFAAATAAVSSLYSGSAEAKPNEEFEPRGGAFGGAGASGDFDAPSESGTISESAGSSDD